MHTTPTDVFEQVRTQHARLPRESGLQSFGQVGIVVDDLADAGARLGAELGIRTWYRPRQVVCRTWIGEQTLNQSFEFLLGYCAGVQIELLKVCGPDRGIFARLPADETGRIHHVGYFVRDIQGASQRLQACGLDEAQSGVVKVAPNAKTRFSYWQSGEAGSGVVELIEQRVSGLRTGMPEWLVQFGAVAGTFERASFAAKQRQAQA